LTASWRGGYQRYIRALHLTIAPGLNCLSEEVPLFTVNPLQQDVELLRNLR
jgi:hypothetical protein